MCPALRVWRVSCGPRLDCVVHIPAVRSLTSSRSPGAMGPLLPAARAAPLGQPPCCPHSTYMTCAKPHDRTARTRRHRDPTRAARGSTPETLYRKSQRTRRARPPPQAREVWPARGPSVLCSKTPLSRSVQAGLPAPALPCLPRPVLSEPNSESCSELHPESQVSLASSCEK